MTMSRVTPSDKWQRARSKTAAIAAFKRPVRPVAKGSRVAQKLSGSYIYFLVLERSWWYAIALALGLYAVSIVACALLATTARLVNTQRDLEEAILDAVAPRWEKCLRFAAAHVLTMSGGNVVPVDTWSHALSWLQIAVGLLVNVFVFSVVVAKFQAPHSDLVWSGGCVLLSRDGVPHLLMRVGNLRCHTLYSPRVRLTLLRRHVTNEGESFFRRDDLVVDQPATVSGIHTVAHAISGGSPLRELYESGTLQRSLRAAADDAPSLLIHAVIQAFDNVYGGDLSATHTYGKESLLEGAFADMIRSDKGRVTIDWDAFNATVSLGELARRKGSSPVRDADPEPPAPQPGRPYISCGSARASYGTAGALDGGAPRSALELYCPYSTRLCLLLAEGGVEFEIVKIDLTAVQSWYSAAFKPGDAPAMWGTPGGKPGEGWVGGSKECRDRAVAEHEGVRKANEARASMSEAEVASFGETLIFGGLAPRIAGSSHPKGSKVSAFMLKKTLGVEKATELLVREDKENAMDEARSACRERFKGALHDVAKLLAGAVGRGFLGGKNPDPSDINLGGAVYTVKALLDSGLADVEASMPPELERYLERWCRRDSWMKIYGTGQTFNAVIVRSFANKLCTVAPDVCSPESVRAACDRARVLDPRYQALLKSTTTRVHAAPSDDGAICI